MRGQSRARGAEPTTAWNLGERKSMPSLGKASVSAAAATLHRSPQSKHRGSWGKRLKDFTEGHLVFQSLNISSVVNTIW